MKITLTTSQLQVKDQTTSRIFLSDNDESLVWRNQLRQYISPYFTLKYSSRKFSRRASTTSAPAKYFIGLFLRLLAHEVFTLHPFRSSCEIESIRVQISHINFTFSGLVAYLGNSDPGNFPSPKDCSLS